MLWIIGAASTVLLSFLLVAIAVRLNPRVEPPVQLNLLRWQMGRAVTGQTIRFVARLLAVGALILIVVAGIIGDQTPTRNLAPTAIWIAWWVGVSYLSAFIGNVWCVINPWAALFECYEQTLPIQSAWRGARIGWPKHLGVWPATALFIVFAWVELVWDGRSIPWQLARLAIGFSVLTWIGMYLFGRHTWLRHGDPFALAFSVLARFAPTEMRADRWILRPPGTGLLDTKDVTPSLVVFVLVMLSTVTFDGLMATPLWQRIENTLYEGLSALGNSRLAFINTFGLLAFCAIFVAVYRAVATLVANASQGSMTVDAASRAFVLTLVPIAIAYLIAHYLSYFLIQGQLLIRLASDPFGFEWNIFGSAHFRPNIGIVGARFTWYTSLFAIVVGHVIAVSLAHVIALRNIADPRAAMRSQIPMVVLMVAYTMMSLWIIAQPIVE
ncbi:MAG TPA: hypothetical protein VJ865_10115 [Gemmatimonadaceae bacterium]|nr:hypothetical protein [Gemmatimonadaceae bacterium]